MNIKKLALDVLNVEGLPESMLDDVPTEVFSEIDDMPEKEKRLELELLFLGMDAIPDAESDPAPHENPEENSDGTS